LKLSAYVLLGDPSWLVPSIRSYYDKVTRIIASYDEGYRSWSGEDMGPQMRECIRLLRENDPENKVVFTPGCFAFPDGHPQAGETIQRQVSLEAASDFGDWVLQLDTDEIAQDVDRIIQEINVADHLGFEGLEYPARWIYAHIMSHWFLEMSTRRLGAWDAIPGPIAVRAGTNLRHARQADIRCRRLQLSPSTHDEHIDLSAAILHFSMVRTEAAMRWKASISGHAPDLNWDARLRLWREARDHPIRAIIRSVARPTFGSYRLVRLPDQFGPDMVGSQTLIGDPCWLRSDDPPHHA
jgi:hypothetical protein